MSYESFVTCADIYCDSSPFSIKQVYTTTQDVRLRLGHLERVEPVEGGNAALPAGEQEVTIGRDGQGGQALVAVRADQVAPIHVEDMQAQVGPGVHHQHARPWRQRQQHRRDATSQSQLPHVPARHRLSAVCLAWQDPQHNSIPLLAPSSHEQPGHALTRGSAGKFPGFLLADGGLCFPSSAELTQTGHQGEVCARGSCQD